jgi:hypothetical protein
MWIHPPEGGAMDAYEVMHEWDRALNKPPRSNEDLDRDVPGTLPGYDYEEWKALLEERNVDAIMAGMRSWGLPIEPLGQFEVDMNIEVIERPYSPES